MGTVPAEKGEGSREARHYCLVREDLAPEMKMVMIGHAAGESGVLGLAQCLDCERLFGSRRALKVHRNWHRRWLTASQCP